jgi:hypothetical protein
VHNSFLSIGGAFSSIGEDGGMTFDVGVSTRFIPNALLIAFVGYIHLASLVVHGEVAEELARLWHEHRYAFTVIVGRTARDLRRSGRRLGRRQRKRSRLPR